MLADIEGELHDSMLHCTFDGGAIGAHQFSMWLCRSILRISPFG